MSGAGQELLPGLYHYVDGANVYVIAGHASAITFGFGNGTWLADWQAQGRPPLAQVFLTNHHPDQCRGLERDEPWPFVVHAPVDDEPFLDPARLPVSRVFDKFVAWPASYHVVEHGIPGVEYDLTGFALDHFWEGRRIRGILTPGHGRRAVSLIVDHAGKQVVFCGDACHAGATLHQPYVLEWDHWTGEGTLAAWEGIRRLARIRVDLLCPAHGPVIADDPAGVLEQLADKLTAFYHVHHQMAVGQPDRYLPMTEIAPKMFRLSPHLYRYGGGNGLLLLSDAGEALVVDPIAGELDGLRALLARLGNPRVAAVTATHAHWDHVGDLTTLRDEFGATVWLHPVIADCLRDPQATGAPWVPANPIFADELLPADGHWQWQEYDLRVAHWPSQTWWHMAMMGEIDGRRVLFGGDNFQPPSRWNGSGGFASHMSACFGATQRSVDLLLDWAPDAIAGGHHTYFAFDPTYAHAIQNWARRAAPAVRALCPSGELHHDYYMYAHQRD